MVQKIILILVVAGGILSAQLDTTVYAPRPVLKSALIPGWGQLGFKKSQRARSYFISEGLLILATVGSRQVAHIKKKTYIAYATEHAQVNSSGKDHQYWVDIGNYSTLDDYNAEHLRNRDTENLYPLGAEWNWVWDSKQNRTSFERMRIQSDQWKQVSTFLIGGIILNHCISAIDALYLKRTLGKSGLSFRGSLDPANRSAQVRMIIQF
jgi:hypothetical protein